MRLPRWVERLVRLSRREYFADFFITPPVTLALAVWSLSDGFGFAWVALFAAGWLAWTLYEYGVHRISHHAPVLVDIHRLHHADQRDYIGLHPALTLTIYAAIWLLFGFNAAPFAIGFSTGYVAYAALHTAFHYATIRKGDLLWPMKVRHLVHHRDHDRCFGVTTSLWDRLFGTA